MDSSSKDYNKVIEDADNVAMNKEHKWVQADQGKHKRKYTSIIWINFEKLVEKTVAVEGKTCYKCKKCRALFLCYSRYGSRNLKQHITNCVSGVRNVEQMLVDHNLRLQKGTFDPIAFHDLLARATVMHDLPHIYQVFSHICIMEFRKFSLMCRRLYIC